MERIFKIKLKHSPDHRGQYPSERRYSASMVMGLSVVFLQLFLFAILMGILIVHKLTTTSSGQSANTPAMSNGSEDVSLSMIVNDTEKDFQRLHDRIEKDLALRGLDSYYINIPALVCSGCFVMGLGSVSCFLTGVLASKRWYIDHYITFFFLTATFSTLTSAICLLLAVLATVNMNFNFEEYENNYKSPISFSLAINIVILSSVGVIWSFLASRVAYKGMRNSYPDDIVVGRGVEIATVMKGSKKSAALPPDILNHFPLNNKLAKYLPKKENTDLPKAESNFEYRQRVDNFLSGEHDGTENISKL